MGAIDILPDSNTAASSSTANAGPLESFMANNCAPRLFKSDVVTHSTAIVAGTI